MSQEKTRVYPWQQKRWQTLHEQQQQQRLPHALLLTGTPGMGQSDFAQALAKKVLCGTEAEQACGHCRSCVLWAAGSHPDYYFIQLQEKSKAIKVDQVRQLIGKLTATAQRADQYQVAVLDPAATLNRAAANALLKTLEEPAGKVLLILVADQVGTLPATILSRCQRIHFDLEDVAQAQAWLTPQLPDPTQADLLLRLADNAPLRALALSETDYLSLRDTVLRQLIAVFRRKESPIAPAAIFIKEELRDVIHIFLTLMNDIARLQLGVTADYILNTDRLDPLRKLAVALPVIAMQRYVIEVQSVQQLLIRQANVNSQLLMEELLLSWLALRNK